MSDKSVIGRKRQQRPTPVIPVQEAKSSANQNNMTKTDVPSGIEQEEPVYVYINDEPHLQLPEIQQVHENLFLGNLAASLSPYVLRLNGITHVISVMEEQKPIPDVTQHHVFLRDVTDFTLDLQKLFHDVYAHILFQLLKNPKAKILIHCVAGISRSPAMILAFQLLHYPISYSKAYKQLLALRAFIEPNVLLRIHLRLLYFNLRIRSFLQCMDMIPASDKWRICKVNPVDLIFAFWVKQYKGIRYRGE
jgi:predicted protein tyrosine phosphatase